MMNNKYLITADHLGFRPIQDEDLKYLIQLDGDAETMKFFPDGFRSEEQIKENIQRYKKDYADNGYGILMVFNLNSAEFIGRSGFANVDTGDVEIGYLILKKFWSQGFATQIMKILLPWARDNIKRDKIIAFTPTLHIASAKVMQKAGMTYVKNGMMKGVECVIYEYKF